ncbi:hypothetical protein J6590_099980 [Homalodisca vitripennis]|nr:hypothetical protein J6590_099980 [Homalodisca vitripennis]
MLTGTTVSAVIVVASHVSCSVCRCSLNNVKLQPPVIMKQYSVTIELAVVSDISDVTCGVCQYKLHTMKPYFPRIRIRSFIMLVVTRRTSLPLEATTSIALHQHMTGISLNALLLRNQFVI